MYVEIVVKRLWLANAAGEGAGVLRWPHPLLTGGNLVLVFVFDVMLHGYRFHLIPSPAEEKGVPM